MAGKTKVNKREAILDAMLDVVVERGFHEAPMSLIAERSGTSAGLIYHHFASKEAIIHALFERVNLLKVESILKGFTAEMKPRDAFVRGCLNTYAFYRKHQREMKFLEQYESAGFVCRGSEQSREPAVLAFEKMFSRGSKGGVLNEWPREIHHALTIGLVERLARQPRKISEAVLRDVAEKLWAMLRA